MRAATLSVKNWDEFQHYKDRDPVWIKLYGRLLDDADFLALPEAAQAQLVKLWLVASRCRNQIRDDANYLRCALHTRRLYIDELVASGFLERSASVVLAKVEHVASPALATRKHNASPRALAREEKRRTKGADGAAPWMGGVREVWRERFQAEPPGQAVKVLRPLVNEHGIERVLAHLTAWLDRTEPRYLNLQRFAATFAEWGPKTPRGANGLDIPDADTAFGRLGI